MDGLDGAKIVPKSSAIWVGGNKITDVYRRQTGGQTTDRQTDLRRHKANVATLHSPYKSSGYVHTTTSLTELDRCQLTPLFAILVVNCSNM